MEAPRVRFQKQWHNRACFLGIAVAWATVVFAILIGDYFIGGQRSQYMEY